MRKILLVLSGTIILFLPFTNFSFSGQLSSYPNTSGLNWQDQIPVVLGASNSNANINWYSLISLVSNNFNWPDVQLLQQSTSGINWYFLDIKTGGLNWYAIANGASANNMACWKSNGQLGKCTTSVSGVNCTACN